jgi:type VI secretion system protein ImpG
MDDRLLRLYEDELRFLRDMGGEFAAAFPKVASRLGLDAAEATDPYVERLLEGCAFLTARVQLKLESQFPAFTQHLLEMVYPHYLAPTPSMAVAQFTPDPDGGRLEKGYAIPAGTSLIGRMARDGITACEFRTAHPVHLWPIAIAGADYFATPAQISALQLPERSSARAALRLRLRTTNGLPFERLALTSLCCFLPQAGGIGGALLGQLLADCSGLVLQPPGWPVAWRETLPARSIRHTGFGEQEAILPYGPRSFSGYRLLQEFFALPERVLFLEFSGLADAVRRCTGPELELIVLLHRPEPRLERGVGAGSFALHTTPVVNLFRRRADRLTLSDRAYEHHLVADRVRPMDLEVHSVLEVIGEGEAGTPPIPFRPFYSVVDAGHAAGHATAHGTDHAAYYTIRREKRLTSARQALHGSRSSYAGSEIFLSLVDRNNAPVSPTLRQLAVTCLCTNRDLPLLMPIGGGASDFTLEIGAPVQEIRCLVGPTPPRSSTVHGNTAWQLISHLSLTYLSITDREGAEGDGADALRAMLLLYADRADPAVARQVEGIRSVVSVPVVRRLPGGGQAAIARGLEVTLTLDETAFEGTGVVPLGAVLSGFFARHAGINSFTETVIRVDRRGEVMRWPMQTGRRPAL